MKNAKGSKVASNDLLTGLGFAAVGLLLLISPQTAEAIITTVIGVVALLIGIVRVACYFLQEKDKTAVGSNLATGLSWIAGGIIFLTMGPTLFALLPVLMGCFDLFGGFRKLQIAMNLRKMDVGMWKVEMIAAIVFIAVGILIIVNPFAALYTLMRIAGASILIEGAYGLFERPVYNNARRKYAGME